MADIHVLIGTNNEGKFGDAQFIRDSLFPNLTIHSPKDLGITGDVEETGTTYTENAHIKRDFFMDELVRLGLQDYYVISDDGGIEIDALSGEPGIHSRRWKDHQNAMTDNEIIEYALERLKDVPEGQRIAAFAGIVALGQPGSSLSLDIPYRLEGTLLTKPVFTELDKGYPFRGLFFLPQYGKMLSEISHMPRNERPDGFLSHRELGIKAAFEKIIDLQGGK